jgi:hypothetical protein
MPRHRLTAPLTGIPVSGSLTVTIPAGAIVEADTFLAAAGLVVVIWNGRRITVSIRDFKENAESCP